ncbi:hypothetical protein ACK36E_20105, partial [Aeromonas veronii]
FHVEPPAFKIRENSTYEHLSFSGGLPSPSLLLANAILDDIVIPIIAASVVILIIKTPLV